MPGRQEYAAAMGEAAGDLGGVCGHGRVEEREIGNLGDPRRSWLRPSTVFRKAMHLREPDVVGEGGPADSARRAARDPCWLKSSRTVPSGVRSQRRGERLAGRRSAERRRGGKE